MFDITLHCDLIFYSVITFLNWWWWCLAANFNVTSRKRVKFEDLSVTFKDLSVHDLHWLISLTDPLPMDLTILSVK